MADTIDETALHPLYTLFLGTMFLILTRFCCRSQECDRPDGWRDSRSDPASQRRSPSSLACHHAPPPPPPTTPSHNWGDSGCSYVSFPSCFQLKAMKGKQGLRRDNLFDVFEQHFICLFFSWMIFFPSLRSWWLESLLLTRCSRLSPILLIGMWLYLPPWQRADSC